VSDKVSISTFEIQIQLCYIKVKKITLTEHNC